MPKAASTLTAPASVPRSTLPIACPPWNVTFMNASARARAQFGSSSCAWAFTLEVTEIHAIPVTAHSAMTSGTQGVTARAISPAP